METHEYYMKAALRQAEIAFEQGEIPVGAVVVCEGKIISQAHNQTQILKDPTAHAEMLAITSACNYLGAKYLIGCDLYVTLEPCIMCYGAIHWAQVSTIIFGASDDKKGFSKMLNPYFKAPKTNIISGVLEQNCENILKDFFGKIRGQ